LRWPEFEPLAALALVPLLAPLARTPAPAARPTVELAPEPGVHRPSWRDAVEVP
jgi:hypothetical protein